MDNQTVNPVTSVPGVETPVASAVEAAAIIRDVYAANDVLKCDVAQLLNAQTKELEGIIEEKIWKATNDFVEVALDMESMTSAETIRRVHKLMESKSPEKKRAGVLLGRAVAAKMRHEANRIDPK